MYYINLIRQVLKCNEDVAQEVLDNMGEYHLSNMSNAQIKRAIKETHATIKMTKGKSVEEIHKMMLELMQGK
jgi:cell pole-organizing protein PopZ